MKTVILQKHANLVEMDRYTSALAIQACYELLYHTNRQRRNASHLTIFHYVKEHCNHLGEHGLR